MYGYFFKKQYQDSILGAFHIIIRHCRFICCDDPATIAHHVFSIPKIKFRRGFLLGRKRQDEEEDGFSIERSIPDGMDKAHKIMPRRIYKI
ncbi:MAG: hypothetical protein LBS09_05085 [Bacteroidales bacterium]|nr:hypothetical protein [Bacteroidales bacterium]